MRYVVWTYAGVLPFDINYKLVENGLPPIVTEKGREYY